MIKHLISLVLVILLVPFALADYHYASHTGTNTPPYSSWATAADSIQKAIDAAAAGDTVYVGAGVWDDAPYSLIGNLAIIGAGADSTTLRKTGRVRFFYARYGDLIQGFTIDNVDIYMGTVGIECYYHDTSIVIRDNIFHNLRLGILAIYKGEVINNLFVGTGRSFTDELAIDNSPTPSYAKITGNTFSSYSGGVMIAFEGQWVVTNNIFIHNPDTGDRMLVLTIGNRPGDTAYVANNIFYENYYSSTLPYYWELIAAGPGVTLYNNTIIGLDTTYKFTAYFTSSNGKATNNIISRFLDCAKVYYNDGILRLDYNDFWDNQAVISPRNHGIIDSANNLSCDPMFLSRDNFYLQLYSPLIDAGDPTIVDVNSSRSDIGAYGGPLGQSYIYQDLAPAIPESLGADIGDDSLLIRWHYNTESDFDRYYLFRDTIMGFTPSFFNLIAMPDTSLYVDRDFDRQHNYYYRISGIDYQGNMSYPSQELGVRFISIDNSNPLLPSVTEIKSTYPNPFNSMITIGYYLADIGYQPAEVKLYIYDIGGRLVRKLVDCRQNPGRYTVTWDGKTDGGEQLSSGVYFSRLSVSGIELRKPRKITLVK